MPLDFPSSPTNGQVYQQYVYDSSLPGWRSKGGAVAATYTSDTAPSGAVKGDMWYRTSDGTTYVYVVDADTSQWVEIRSEVAASKVGLTPLIPTSVAVGSGTGSVSSSGLVTFSGVSSVGINGMFTSTYANYRFVMTIPTTSASANLLYRMRSNNVEDATYQYTWFQNLTYDSGATTGEASYSQPSAKIGSWYTAYSNTGLVTVTGDIVNPQKSLYTVIHSVSSGSSPSSNVWMTRAGISAFGLTTSFDGITFIPSAGTIGGTVQFYGYN